VSSSQRRGDHRSLSGTYQRRRRTHPNDSSQRPLTTQTLNANTESPSSFWDSGKEIDLDTLVAIADTLDEHGLRPVDPPKVIGFESVDEFIQHIDENLQPPAGRGTDDYYD
jgi:hypothetical protein